MMELIIFPKGTRVYRSFDDNSKREGYWFSLNENDTYGYGSHTAEFIVNRDLRLINIANSNFYNLLQQTLKDASLTNDTLNVDHHGILFPLGFDNIVFYRELAEQYGIDPQAYKLNPVVHTNSLLYFNNRSRLSLNQLDVKLLKFLKSILSSASDGIISLKPFPDIIRNGMQFPELSVYDKSYIDYVQEKPRHATSGGGMHFLPPLKLDNEAIRKSAEGAENLINYINTNKIKVDLNKIVITERPYIEGMGNSTHTANITLSKIARKTRRCRRTR